MTSGGDVALLWFNVYEWARCVRVSSTRKGASKNQSQCDTLTSLESYGRTNAGKGAKYLRTEVKRKAL